MLVSGCEAATGHICILAHLQRMNAVLSCREAFCRALVAASPLISCLHVHKQCQLAVLLCAAAHLDKGWQIVMELMWRNPQWRGLAQHMSAVPASFTPVSAVLLDAATGPTCANMTFPGLALTTRDRLSALTDRVMRLFWMLVSGMPKYRGPLATLL